MLLLELPPEILQYLIQFLSLPSLAVLSLTNQELKLLCSTYGFKIKALELAYSPITSAHAHSQWSWSQICEYSVEVDRRWSGTNSRGEVLGGFHRTFPSKYMPILRLWKQPNGRGRVLIGRGEVIELWEADELGRSWNSAIEMIVLGKVAVSRRAGMDDITGIAVVDGSPDDLVISRVSGQVSRFRYEEAHDQDPARLIEITRYGSSVPQSNNSTSTINGIQSCNNLLASISTTRPKLKAISINSPNIFPQQIPHSHLVQMQSLSSPWVPPISISYTAKPWSLLLSSTTLIVGHTGLAPLSIHTLSQGGTPLPSSSTRHYSAGSTKSSIYGLASPSSLSSFLRPDTTIIAAYYDSAVRVYDTRSSQDEPIMELADHFNDDPAYSVASGGANGAYIVVGTSRNAAIRVFDIRFSKLPIISSPPAHSAITFFAPGKDRSPVYSLAVEFGKIWGVTDSRAFSIGFENVEGWTRSKSEEEVSYYEHGVKGIELKKSKGGRAYRY